MKKRAVILLGAGASVEYGAPTTDALTDAIAKMVAGDEWMQHSGGAAAFEVIRTNLEQYRSKPKSVNFEHIYHCAHELIFTFAPIDGAINEYRPLLVPFVQNISGIDQRAVRALTHTMVRAIFTEMVEACEKNQASLAPLTDFLEYVRNEYTTRIYTTNYDDFPLRAVPDLYNGYPGETEATERHFDPKEFWERQDVDAVLHLHGSIHMAATIAGPDGLAWFREPREALTRVDIRTSDRRRMDGTSWLSAPIVTGVDKLSRLQQRPLSHFYAAMAQDVASADVIYVIGSGLGDLHVNNWLKDARDRASPVPLLFIDYWPEGFLKTIDFVADTKVIEMLHSLRIDITDRSRGQRVGAGWTLATDCSAAVWDQGFQAFLDAPTELEAVLARMHID